MLSLAIVSNKVKETLRKSRYSSALNESRQVSGAVNGAASAPVGNYLGFNNEQIDRSSEGA